MSQETTKHCVMQQLSQTLERLPRPESESALWKKRSIYKVPPCFADLNKKAYHPQLVSFGPYHHGEDHLRPMEDHKHRALLHFLTRSGKTLKWYVDSLRDITKTLRECYHPLESTWRDNTERFLELMILDGCFMLEVMSQIFRTGPQAPNSYADNDPIFGSRGAPYIVPFLRRDMLMIENQLPILLLERLVAVESDGRKGKDDIIRLVLEFFKRGHRQNCISDMGDCVHVLDVYRMTLLPHGLEIALDRPKPILPNKKDDPPNMPSATKLHQAGIRFKEVVNGHIGDISFKNGVLKVPVIVVDDSMESIYLNLMTFESLHINAGNEVTSYMSLMDDLIDSGMDVALLRSKKIIKHFLGSDKLAANLINSLGKDKALEFNRNLSHVREMVNEHYNKPWNKWRANLMHTYFRNPWSMLSLIAAVYLFALTTVQTTYTVLQYKHPGK